MFKSWEELSRKEQLEATVWDMYKDAYGVRPRHLSLELEAMTEEQLSALCDDLQVVIERVMDEQAAEESMAVERFEQRVKETISLGAADRETAIRWIGETIGARGDLEFLCYKMGLPYNYLNKK